MFATRDLIFRKSDSYSEASARENVLNFTIKKALSVIQVAPLKGYFIPETGNISLSPYKTNFRLFISLPDKK